MIYLDYAATSPMRPESIEAMRPYWAEYAANPSAQHSCGREARRVVDDARGRIAALLHVLPSEVFFTSGGTESNNWALFGLKRLCFQSGLAVSAIEHPTVLEPARKLAEEGCSLKLIPADRDGIITPDALSELISEKGGLVSVMLVNNEIGTIQPIRELAEIAHKKGAILHCDAVQAVGHIPVDMRELGADLLSISAHKFGGPKGIGVLIIRKSIPISPLLYGGGQEMGLRSGTENVPGITAAAAALEAAARNMDTDQVRLACMRNRLAEHIMNGCEDARINGCLIRRLPGNLHMTFKGVDQDALLLRLDLAGIKASAGSACSSGVRSRSHVIFALGTAEENEADLRLSLGPWTTLEEIDEAGRIIIKTVSELRK